MRRLLAFGLGLLSLLSGCAPTLSRPDHIQTPPLHFVVPQVDHTTLSNGIHLYFREDHELPLVSLTVMARGGAGDDPADKVGLASLLARALRTGGAGPRTPDQVDAGLERIAADFNISADTYSLSFELSLLATDLLFGIDLLRDTLRTPGLDPSRIELARRQMLEAIRRQNDHPQAIAGRVFQKAVYGDSPLGRTPTEESVQAISHSDLLAAYREIITPGNLWIAVSGDFDRAQIIAALEARFSSWSVQESPPRPLPQLGHPAGGIVIVGQKEVPQTVVMLGQLGVDKSAVDLQAVRVMNFILGGGSFNSRMMKEIREERGLAYSVQSYFQVGRFLPGPFVAQCETRSGTTLEALNLMRAEIERIRNEQVTSEELRVAKESLINSFVFSFTDPHEVVTQAMRLDFYDYPADYLQSYRDKIEALTIADVQKAARERLHPEQMTIVLVGDEARFDAPVASLGLPIERLSLPQGKSR